MSASSRGVPAARAWFVKSTSRMAFLVTRPISMMRPIMLMMLRLSPVASRARATPTSDSGSESMIANGWKKRPELRGEDQVDEDDGEEEGLEHVA